ncbi:unnamed protein product [Lactuca saligna]|uniref:Uncharacterized protein n=1 Tax=Lactuca saligna TaxID=75948 RepID=A0AA35YJG2_LACSI|nr:unnamed protein product [Lactuca saligna]
MGLGYQTCANWYFLDHGCLLVSSHSFTFDSLSEEPDTEVGLEKPLDFTTSWDHGSGGALGVKEVQWITFATKLVENDGNWFGSYNYFWCQGFENHRPETLDSRNSVALNPR